MPILARTVPVGTRYPSTCSSVRSIGLRGDAGGSRARSSRVAFGDVSASRSIDGAVVAARDLTAGFGARLLFSGLDLVIGPGDVVGVVGANGAGKSTLLRLLAGVETPSTGRSSSRLRRRRSATSRRNWTSGGGDAHRVPAPSDRCGRCGCGDGQDSRRADRGRIRGRRFVLRRPRPLVGVGWRRPGRADRRGARRVGLAAEPDTEVTALSGGQAARAGLASLLLARFDVLALDEPTNDLDLAGLDLLERFVTVQRVGMVLVSHDREFLARTVTEIVELDLAQQRVSYYDGGYQAYLDERAIARRQAREAYEEYADRKEELHGRARMQRDWMSQGVGTRAADG